MAGHQPRSQLDVLDQSVNEVLIHVGKALRAQGKNGRKAVSALSAAKINESNILFNATLDGFETEILRAKAILRRDLELVRAKKSIAASVSTAAQQETPAPGAASSLMHQAPPASMDIDSVEPTPTAAGGAKVATKVKPEFGSDASANGISAKPAMAPFPNMDIDTPTAVPALPTSAPMAASNSNRSQGKQQANGKSPAVKKEALSRSPQQTAKPVPVPGRAASTAGLNGVSKATAATKKANSPAATKVPSPAASKSTVSPVASRVPSPVLVKSAASPAVKIPGSQPPTPTLHKAAAGKAAAGSGISKTMSMSSSSSPSVTTTSPVLAKKAAATKAVSRSTTPVPVPRIPTPATVPAVLPPVTAPPAAPVPAMEASSTDINMDNFFDLTGPAGGNETATTDQGFTDMQFSLVPIGASEDPKQQQQQQQQQQKQKQRQKQLNNKRPQPQQQPVVPQPQAPSSELPTPSQNQNMDDFEFDVEKFATDAAQNLLTDNSFVVGSTNANQQPQTQTQPQKQPQTQTQPQVAADTAMTGTGAADDDLFKFIDDGMEGLADDTTTNFEDLFMDNMDNMDNTDSVDLDSFFDA